MCCVAKRAGVNGCLLMDNVDGACANEDDDCDGDNDDVDDDDDACDCADDEDGGALKFVCKLVSPCKVSGAAVGMNGGWSGGPN